MDKLLRVLIVEDSEDDALLVIRELERGGYDTTFKRVETAEAMTAALEKQSWDIIIADYHLPHFSAPEALELFHQSGLDLPFIVISGTIGEEIAVETMKAGAHDYLMKDNLTRLVPAIERELHESEVRKERKRAQEELKVAEENFRNSLDNSPLGIRIITAEGELLYANQAILDIYGYSSVDELRVTPAKNRHTPESYAEHQERAQIRKLGRPVQSSYEISIVRKDGEIRHLAVSRKAVVWNGEKQYQSIYQDTTERRQMEEALRESEQNFRNSLDSSPLGIAIGSKEGELIYANQALLNISGYSSIKELKAVPEEQRYTPQTCAEQQERRRLREPTPANFEIGLVRKDGEVRHLIVFRKEVIWDGEKRFQAIYQDITERKQAEEKIKRAAKEWSTTFDSITDLVSIHDKDFRLVRVNKAFADIFNVKPEELVGKTCYQVVHGTNECVPSCTHMKTLETKEPVTADFFEPHLGIHLEVATSPIFNEKGEVVASVHIARDISERKKMQERLMVSDRLTTIGELASGIAHELNNPLTSIIGFSELLLDKDVPEDVKEDLRVINREALRTSGIVRNLLTFTRKHETESQPADINDAVQKVLELRAYEHRVSNIQVNAHFDTDLPEIIANSSQLQQVFLNIIINAEHSMIKTHGGGTLTITTEQAGDIIRVSLADDGPGITRENLGHLFDPFFTTKGVGEGTGLGLSICHGIVTEHGGRIYAESQPGKGATFIVELPFSKS